MEPSSIALGDVGMFGPHFFSCMEAIWKFFLYKMNDQFMAMIKFGFVFGMINSFLFRELQKKSKMATSPVKFINFTCELHISFHDL